MGRTDLPFPNRMNIFSCALLRPGRKSSIRHELPLPLILAMVRRNKAGKRKRRAGGGESSMEQVPLERAFLPVHEAYQRDDIPLDGLDGHFGRGERKYWDALLAEHRVVILADACAGKTHEMR